MSIFSCSNIVFLFLYLLTLILLLAAVCAKIYIFTPHRKCVAKFKNAKIKKYYSIAQANCSCQLTTVSMRWLLRPDYIMLFLSQLKGQQCWNNYASFSDVVMTARTCLAGGEWSGIDFGSCTLREGTAKPFILISLLYRGQVTNEETHGIAEQVMTLLVHSAIAMKALQFLCKHNTFLCEYSQQWNLRIKDTLKTNHTVESIVERMTSSWRFYYNGNSYFWDITKCSLWEVVPFSEGPLSEVPLYNYSHEMHQISFLSNWLCTFISLCLVMCIG